MCQVCLSPTPRTQITMSTGRGMWVHSSVSARSSFEDDDASATPPRSQPRTRFSTVEKLGCTHPVRGDSCASMVKAVFTVVEVSHHLVWLTRRISSCFY